MSGQWVAFALGSAGVIGLIMSGGVKVLSGLSSIVWNTTNSLTLTTIPLFILMGEVMLQTGISRRFYLGITPWIKRLPGGLLHTNIIASLIVSAVCGSTAATAAAVGTVAAPELIRRGYNLGMIAGTLGGASLGLLIPPSIMMIAYGAMVQESVSKLFMAGVLPGVVAGILLVTYTTLRAIVQPEVSPVDKSRDSWGVRFSGLLGIFPITLLLFIIWGGIYSGFMTPSEVAAIAVIVVLIVGGSYKELTTSIIFKSLTNSARVSSNILFIIIGAQILSFLFVKTGTSRGLVEFVERMNLSALSLFLVIVILYLFLGTMLEGFSMMFLTLPVLYPVIESAGFNRIWFGVVLVLLIEIAQITPPVGINLFVIQGTHSRLTFDVVVKGMLPYMLLLLLTVAFVWIWPGLALWLPSTM
jgi:C4-dicarboxylate transporter DctM subunit